MMNLSAERRQADLLDRLIDGSQPIDRLAHDVDLERATEGLAALASLASDLRLALAPEGPSPAFATASRARLVRQLRAAPATVEPSLTLRSILSLVSRPRWALASILLVVLVAFSSAGVALAAAGSLPGDALFGLKRGLENARLALSLSPAGDAELLSGFADLRLAELQSLAREGRQQDLEAAGIAYAGTLDDLIALLEESGGELPGSLIAGTGDQLTVHQQVLTIVKGQVPASAQLAIELAIQKSSHGQEVLEQLQQGGSPSDLAPGRQDDSGEPGSEPLSEEPVAGPVPETEPSEPEPVEEVWHFRNLTPYSLGQQLGPNGGPGVGPPITPPGQQGQDDECHGPPPWAQGHGPPQGCAGKPDDNPGKGPPESNPGKGKGAPQVKEGGQEEEEDEDDDEEGDDDVEYEDEEDEEEDPTGTGDGG